MAAEHGTEPLADPNERSAPDADMDTWELAELLIDEDHALCSIADGLADQLLAVVWPMVQTLAQDLLASKHLARGQLYALLAPQPLAGSRDFAVLNEAFSAP